MGAQQSTPRARTPTLPRIETLDEFKARFRQVFRNEYLSPREHDWLQTIFEKFASTSQPPTCWNESDLIGFLGVTLPTDLKPDLEIAGPLLYRCLRRLGAFPWHNRPLQTGGLDIESLGVALVILLRRYEEHDRVCIFPTADHQGCVEYTARQLDNWLERLLFQCMSVASDRMDQSNEEALMMDSISDKSVGDNAHVLQAHALVLRRNRYRDEDAPKGIVIGPPIIDASDLPSSNSQVLHGIIPKDELRAFLNIVLATRLSKFGFAKDDAITSTVFDTFLQSETAAEITWIMFKSALEMIVPNMLSTLPQLFAPFILDNDFDHKAISSSSKDEVTLLMREAVKQSLQTSSSSVFDLSTLVKLVTVLPFDIPLGTAAIIHTVTHEKPDLSPIREHLFCDDRPLMLIVKGYAPDPKLDNSEIVFGAFIRQHEREEICIFRLSPTLLAFNYYADAAQYESNYDTYKLHIQKPGGDAAEIMVNEGKRIARLVVPESESISAFTAQEIKITSMSLFGLIAGA